MSPAPARRRLLAAPALLVSALLLAVLPASAGASVMWPWTDASMAGRDAWNSHSNPFEFAIAPVNAGTLHVKWRASTQGDVSATPAVVGGFVYFPDWGGSVHKVDARTGREVWRIRLDALAGEPVGAVSRTGPAVIGGTVYLGDQNGAHLLALDAATGALRWSTPMDAHPAAVLTGAPLVVDGVIYQGVSSTEEASAQDPGYACCTFMGSMNAVRASDGKLLWKTRTTPDNHGAADGYSGNAVWGSTPSLDAVTRTLYFATGNNYSVPDGAAACDAAGGLDCTPPENWSDAIVALDADTGRTKWAFHADPGFDEWNLACRDGMTGGNCPEHPGPDWDFGSGPNLIPLGPEPGAKKIVGVGQKSGAYWALDAATGAVVWKSFPGPGGGLGGILWGSATDQQRIYVAEANSAGETVPLPGGGTTTAGSFAALDVKTGRTLWQIADPSGGTTTGALTVANGVLYAGSMTGHMYAIDARTGAVLWDHAGEGPSNAAPAVVDGTVYWGNGYTKFGGTGTGVPLYAFTVDPPFWCAVAAWLPGCEG